MKPKWEANAQTAHTHHANRQTVRRKEQASQNDHSEKSLLRKHNKNIRGNRISAVRIHNSCDCKRERARVNSDHLSSCLFTFNIFIFSFFFFIWFLIDAITSGNVRFYVCMSKEYCKHSHRLAAAVAACQQALGQSDILCTFMHMLCRLRTRLWCLGRARSFALCHPSFIVCTRRWMRSCCSPHSTSPAST